MNESFREHRPLLFDNLDDELIPHYKKQQRTCLKGRASYKAQGAAAIISNWPDHWSSSVFYWWIALGMIALTVLVIYNSLVTYAMIPSPYSPLQPLITSSHKETRQLDQSNNVFLHIFIRSNQELDLNKYLPYLNKISDDLNSLTFHFIVLLNDTVEDNEIKNKIAMSTVLEQTKEKRAASIATNVIVQKMLLSEYLDASPIKQSWRKVSSDLIPFLVRIISVWEHGGVALNPELSFLDSDDVYNKIIKVLSKHIENLDDFDHKVSHDKNVSKKNVNNIQDIIDAIDNDSPFINSELLEEAESLGSLNKIKFKRNIIKTENTESDFKIVNIFELNKEENAGELITDIEPVYKNDLDSKPRNDILTIDIHGNIVETKARCHAFIGQMFLNLAHNTKVNITDFILNQLSIFCKGQLSNCLGINIITF